MSEYLIAHIGHTLRCHEHVTWWKPGNCGYTICIDKAGLYTAEEARANCRNGQSIALPKAVAEQFARSTPYYRMTDGSLSKLYDGGPHRVVPNSSIAWLDFMPVRLGGCGRLYSRPTPINAKKARAIYIDTIPA